MAIIWQFQENLAKIANNFESLQIRIDAVKANADKPKQ